MVAYDGIGVIYYYCTGFPMGSDIQMRVHFHFTCFLLAGFGWGCNLFHPRVSVTRMAKYGWVEGGRTLSVPVPAQSYLLATPVMEEYEKTEP
jgi:hypothetical protein